MFKDLGLEKEKIKQFLQETLQSTEGPLPDIDICFQLNEDADPTEVTKTVKENIPKTLKFSFIPSMNFSIASFEKLNILPLCTYSSNFPRTSSDSNMEGLEVEIMAIKDKLTREYLFLSDAIALDITSAIFRKNEPLFFRSFYNRGHQTVLDLIRRIIRIKNPKQIDDRGFPALLSYLSKSFPDEGELQKIKRTERHKTFLKFIEMLS